MNVSDKWMLEQMQQVAASMTATLPQTGQNSEPPKTEQGETFQDLMNKARDQKVEAPKKEDTNPAQKAETVQDKAPVQKAERKVVTNMKDPRIRAMAPETQAQIAAGFLTPVEGPNGSLFLRINDMSGVAMVASALPNGETDWSKPVTFTNSNGEQFEVYLDLENGDHKLFQLTSSGEKKQIDLFPEQPKLNILDDPKNLDATVVTTDGKVTTLREAIAEVKTRSSAGGEENAADDSNDDLDAEVMTDSQPLFHDVKAAPVKVGENFQLDTQEPDLEQKLADTIRFAAQQDLRQVEIKLSPENLGTLTIKLTQSADGVLQVVLHTTTAKAESLLNQHISGLNLALQGYGHSEVHVEVQRGEDSQQSQQQQQQQTDPNGHNQQNQQQRRHPQDNGHSGDFVQKLRLGLFRLEDVI